MQKNLVLDFKSHEETSDTVSTSAASFAQVPFEEEESSPSNGQSSSPQDSDVLDKSKKIRKKRNAYQKIDDDIRLRLLEAVQRGETLKSAAKRYHVNYSSAKSIFHIFRKEGRILKKATQEKSFDINLPVGQEITLPTQFLNNYNPNQPNTLCQGLDLSQQIQQSSQPHDFRAERSYSSMEEAVGCSSPFNGLSENFSELLKVRGNIRSNDDMIKPRTHMPVHPSRFNPKVSSNEHLMIPKMQPNQQMCFVPKSNGNPAIRSPAEKIKQFDNFYMNYSNSPLSGNARMIREGSGSNSNRCLQGEFDSFTDMMSAMQGQNLLTESLKEPAIPKLMMPGVPNTETYERRGSFEEEMHWGETLESAAFDTYKSFVDAQMILNNAFRKASLLNNLVHMQRNGSPRFLSY